jgi:hypothetical protein
MGPIYALLAPPDCGRKADWQTTKAVTASFGSPLIDQPMNLLLINQSINKHDID